MLKKSLILMALLMSIKVFAIDLKAVKIQGLVGEKSNGYIGIVSKQAGKDVMALVKEINEKRLSMYQEIAEKNKILTSQVAKMAGKKAIQKTATGNYINTGSGWKRK